MDLILNELSIEGQFFNPDELRESVGRVVLMRNAAIELKVKVYCHANTANRHVRPETALIRALSRDQRMYMISWLTQHGPYWQESQLHSANEWYEADGEIVTETSLAEAAYCVENGIDWRTLSFVPSSWEQSPIKVTHRWDDDIGASQSRDIPVPNYWDMSELEPALIEAEPDPKSWNEFEDAVRRRFTSINFTADSFVHLAGQPLAPGVAGKIFSRLNALDKFWAVGGRSSDEGQRIYENRFTGDRAWFSDSSATEKSKFEKDLTFRVGGVDVFCPWHGKLRLQRRIQFRIHFTWPVPPGGQLHVVYLGLKITVD